jgi:hypothetical protein
MAFEQVELHEASILTNANISKGRSAITVGIDAPLRSEADREKQLSLTGKNS